MGGATGAAKDQGETDDPRTDGVSYAGKVYYISESGNDNNSGLSPDQAWKTLDKVATQIQVGATGNGAPSGSAFLFERGGTFEGHIHVNSPGVDYTFGAYGDRSEARPIILNDTPEAVYGFTTSAGGKDFTIRNLHFIDNTDTIGGGMSLNGTNGVSIINCEIEGFERDGITADLSSNLTIQNSIIYDSGTNGFAGGGVNTKILQSSFIDSHGAHGAYLRGLTNTLIEDSLFVGSRNLGIVVHGVADGVTLRGNEFYGNMNGLSFSGSGRPNANEGFKNVLVEDNLIHDNGHGTAEGLGMLLSSLQNAVFRNNVVYDNRMSAVAFGDGYVGDQQSANVQFQNNLLYGVIISGSRSQDVSFTNNIIMSDSSTDIALTKFGEFPNSELTLDYNLYFMPNKPGDKVIFYNNVLSSVSSLASQFGQEVNGINADPLFVDRAGHVFKLQPGSPAIDTGIVIPGLTDDAMDAPRPQGSGIDIGPYETSAVAGSTNPAPRILSFG